MDDTKENFQNIYIEAEKFAVEHYENFPVISFLIKKELRKDIAIIYWFARTADDLADEGMIEDDERIDALNKFEQRLVNTLNQSFYDSYDKALYTTIKKYNLGEDLFFDLIKAFKQDIVKKEYPTFNELLEYCKNSANPVGRLILQLHNIKDEKAYKYSDSVCSALQLANFWQDIEIDFNKGRIYLPAEDMMNHKVNKKLFEDKEINSNFKDVLKLNIYKTKSMFEEGYGLLGFLKGRLRIEIKWTILGGLEILKMIEENDYDIFRKRPKLSKVKMINLLIKSII